MKAVNILFKCVILLGLIYSYSFADTLYLKNGRSINGVIKKENTESIELEIGGGSVKFLKKEVVRISKTSPEETALLRKKWQEDKLMLNLKLAMQKIEEEAKPRKASFYHDSKGMIVNVNINNKVDAKMVLDTGASITVLTRSLAKKIGINIERLKPDLLVQVADGRSIYAALIILDKVKVENSEARNVEAAVLLEEKGEFGFGDGLLGMSFLKQFNFKIDLKDKKLILEKL